MSNQEIVSREKIKEEVLEKLRSFGEPDFEITEQTDLQVDLGLSSTLRQALALPFTKISSRFGGYAIRIFEARELRLVKQCIDLVHKRANRKKS